MAPMRLEDAERLLLSLELFGMRFGLDRMRRLLTALGSPQEQFASIHVVGTNGKSSTVRMTAAILRRHGLRVGSYLSPHLVSFAERVRIDDADVSGAEFAAAIQRAAAAAEKVDRTAPSDDHVTQFELLTAAALDCFARAGVDVAVVEAGLGGRFDATNVLPSSVAVLTNVGLEHTRWLGPTVADIATEKLDVVEEQRHADRRHRPASRRAGAGREDRARAPRDAARRADRSRRGAGDPGPRAVSAAQLHAGDRGGARVPGDAGPPARRCRRACRRGLHAGAGPLRGGGAAGARTTVVWTAPTTPAA